MLKVATFVEILPEDLSGDGPSSASQNRNRNRVLSESASAKPDDALLWEDLDDLKSKVDQSQGLKAMIHFVKLAQLGRPFTDVCDSDTVHEAFTARSSALGQDVTVLRYRRGNIRGLYYPTGDKVIVLLCVVAKRTDKFDTATRNLAMSRLDQYFRTLRS